MKAVPSKDDLGRQPLILAPLRGVTDAIFRTTFAECFDGVAHAVAPFISTVRGSKVKPKLLRDMLPERNAHLPVIPQILGKDPEEFVTMARALFDLGYDTVNWNLGCPYPMVAKKGRGSGLLPYADRIATFLHAVIPAMGARLSIKTRLGRFSDNEIDALLPLFNTFPLREVIIHPRTGVQMYTGRADRDRFGECFALSRHPVVYNGDIDSLATFTKLAKRFPGVSGWMLGRGLIANPFMAEEIAGAVLTEEDRVVRFHHFHNLLMARYAAVLSGPSHLVQRMKGLWQYFGRPFANGYQVIKRIHKTRYPDQLKAVTERFFTDEARWQSDPPEGRLLVPLKKAS
ncbi:MAG: tRNA-dihydrouridine synthase family protein [Desulfosarcinaceae bacterium]|nr:tRNA-dihydrouridine synthase family protein [Desulfosarcinaceae bacterium]